MNTPTPLTDAAVRKCHGLADIQQVSAHYRYVDVDFARTLERRNRRLVEALRFYADPQTYFAISMFPDPPCGEFITDFEDVGEMSGRQRPGKRARAALSDQQEDKTRTTDSLPPA